MDGHRPVRHLQYASAREHDDERHICPLQLEVIRRGVELWTNPGDIVLSPFAGIGSEGYVTLQMGRRFVGAELKRAITSRRPGTSQWQCAGRPTCSQRNACQTYKYRPPALSASPPCGLPGWRRTNARGRKMSDNWKRRQTTGMARRGANDYEGSEMGKCPAEMIGKLTERGRRR